ncbi:hypothetical protein C8Q72DRAFT_252927 [Fomitopsis betulina]|nr:hypothetical protein C8Q72DRAFT_252927 [Fomitopsis betulina]
MAAAAVAPPAAQPPSPPASTPASSAGVNKRYRPAPAKTFQCRGYGDCRMVFSRSEHLARHIRKHTGERPFSCHCGKQFSRLDNLRQHAQTVHADKQDQNERMMHELTSLHASMTAASKGGARKRTQAAAAAAAVAAVASGTALDIKREDIVHGLPPFHQRPGTSTGYEGAGYNAAATTWHVQTSDVDRPSIRPTHSHSFRDPGQSFRNPTPSTSAFHPGQSFLVPRTFGLPDLLCGSPAGPPRHPPEPTSGPVLPPLAAVVSAALPSSLPLPPPPPGPGPGHPPALAGPLTESHVLPLPVGRRPSTAARPGTAPAAYYYLPSHAFGLAGSQRLGPPLPDQLPAGLPALGRLGGSTLPSLRLARGDGYGWDGRDDGPAFEPTSPVGGYSDSPFSFHAPATAPLPSEHPSYSNPRKRPFSGSDDDDAPPGSRSRGPDGSLYTAPAEYEYGTDSRPQSRRLSVMELCNEPDIVSGAIRPALSLSAGSGPTSAAAAATTARERGSPTVFSRPTTSGLITSASQLALVDRDISPESAPGSDYAAGGYEYVDTYRSPGASLFAGTPSSAGGAAPEAPLAARGAPAPSAGGAGSRAGGVRAGAPPFGGGSLPPAPSASVWQQREPAPTRGPARAAPGWSPLLHGAAGLPHAGPGAPGGPPGGWGRGGVSAAATADAGRGLSPGGRAGSTGSVAGSPRSFGSGSVDGSESRGGNDQVRIPATVGMRA